MIILFGVTHTVNSLINKAFRVDILIKKLLTDNNRLAFCEADTAVGFNRCETCFLSLITVTTAVATAESQSLFVFITEKAESEIFLSLSKFESIPLRSYEDETNAVKVIDPSYAWIIPTGAEKPVKVAFEGQAIVREIENADMSREVQVYKKLGVCALITNNICVYRNTSLKRTVA